MSDKDCLPKGFQGTLSKFTWIIIPIIIAGMFSGFATIQAQDVAHEASQDKKIQTNALAIAGNDVPNLKNFISNEFYEQRVIIESQNNKIDANSVLILENYKLLCKLSNGEC